MGALFALSVGCLGAKAQEQEFRETINKEASFGTTGAEHTLEVYDLNGSITVEGYEGDKVLIEAEKLVRDPDPKDVELGKKEIGVNVLVEGDKIVVYPQIPNMEYRDGRFTNSCQDHWEELPYDHKLDFHIKMPKNARLKVSTINQGEVLVKNTAGSFIDANNINGGIVLEHITGETHLNCINGDVSVSYTQNPTKPCRYYALNGKMDIVYQKNLSANILFKSMNGDLYTDFDIEKQFTKVDKGLSGKGTKAKFKFEAKPAIQIGQGGTDMEVETLNGDVTIKKI